MIIIQPKLKNHTFKLNREINVRRPLWQRFTFLHIHLGFLSRTLLYWQFTPILCMRCGLKHIFSCSLVLFEFVSSALPLNTNDGTLNLIWLNTFARAWCSSQFTLKFMKMTFFQFLQLFHSIFSWCNKKWKMGVIRRIYEFFMGLCALSRNSLIV